MFVPFVCIGGRPFDADPCGAFDDCTEFAFVGRPLGTDPCGTFDVCTRFVLVGLADSDVIFGAKYLMKSGAVDGKPDGIAIGNIYGSTGL